MAYFGFPAAREDDARQAVLAGLELLAALDEMAATVRREQGIELAARVGIHTGVVLVGEMGAAGARRHDSIIGTTPNQAARLQTLAPEGAVVISDDTHEIVRGFFTVESLGRPKMKGIARDVEVFRVIGPTAAVHRLQTEGSSVTRFVGRQAERQRLRERWDAVATEPPSSARGRVLLIRGEAGIGKSRLADSLVADALSGGKAVLTAFCAPDRQASRLYPIAGMLEHAFDLPTGDDDTTLTKLEEASTALGLPARDTVPFLADVIGLGAAHFADALALEPHVLRERTFTAITAVVEADARRGPTLLLVEDLQWADQTTLELIARLASLDPTLPLLILTTARPNFAVDRLPEDRDVIDIGRLAATDHRELVQELAAVHGIPEDLWPVIADRTDGNPLFTEELAKSIAQSSGPDDVAAAAAIPRTIRDLLTARLDALGDNKRMAQVAAVIGREIDVDLLRTVTGLSRRQLAAGLTQLGDAGVVEAIPGVAPPFTHRFVHALVRDAAYESQEQGQRLDAHRRVAESLMRRPNTDPGLIAQHFDAGRVPDQAVEHYVVAATTAQTAAADAEAIRYLDRALALVLAAPDGSARDMSELTVRVVRGRSHVSMQGFSAPGAAVDYRRSLELSERVGTGVDVVSATTAVWAYYLVHGELREAAEALTRLDGKSDPEFDAEISCCVGVQRFFEGEITESRARLEAAVAAFSDRSATGSVARLPMLPSDSYAVALTHLGTVLWLAGETEAAWARLDEAAARARTLPRYPIGAFTEAYVSSYAAWVAILAERFEQGRSLHEHTRELAESYGMLFWVAAGWSGTAIGLGYAGEPRAALDQLEQAMGLWQALGAQAFLPFVVAQRALIRVSIGELHEAFADVEDALAQADITNDHFFCAESHRIRASILLLLDPTAVEPARAELVTAQHMAADQGALVFELRAAIDRARLPSEDGPSEAGDALDTLREVLVRVPAGAEFPDLDRARSLLADASAGNRAAPAQDG